MSTAFPEIVLVRHGETEWAAAGRHTGRTEIPLTPAGEEAASGLASRLAGRIEKATVTINGYSHTYHDDVNILIVAPNGTAVKLMDDVGGSDNGNNATITFEDGAPSFPNAPLGPGSFTFSPSSTGATSS